MQYLRPSADAFASISRYQPKSRLLGYLHICVAALAVMFLVCATPNRSWSATSSLSWSPAHASSVSSQTDLQMWLYTSCGSVNVTSTYYVQDGLSYLVYEGNPIQVVLDYEGNHIYDNAGHLIGYMVQS